MTLVDVSNGQDNLPDMDAFGRAWFTARSQTLDADPGRAWETYVDALALALREPAELQKVAMPAAADPPLTSPLDPPLRADRPEDAVTPRAPWWRRMIDSLQR